VGLVTEEIIETTEIEIEIETIIAIETDEEGQKETTIETDREEAFLLFEPNTELWWTIFLRVAIGEI